MTPQINSLDKEELIQQSWVSHTLHIPEKGLSLGLILVWLLGDNL